MSEERKNKNIIKLDIPETAAERIALQDAKRLPKCWGISRVGDNEKAILVSFDRRLTDNELRYLDELLKGRA